MTNFIADLVFLQKGGFVMYFLLLLSLLVVAIGVERLLYYHRQDAGRAFARDFVACMADCRGSCARRFWRHVPRSR